MRRVMLSHPLPVFGLVSLYLTNYLIGRSPLPRRRSISSCENMGYYCQFPDAIPLLRVRSIVFLALTPLSPPKWFSCNLHALAMPPAFNLSQDQTLQLIAFHGPEGPKRVLGLAVLKQKTDPV